MTALTDSNTLDAAPLVEFVRRQGWTHDEMRNLGLDGSYLKRMEQGKATAISVDLADKVLTRAGASLEMVYPSPEAPDDAPEIRAVCPSCRLDSWFQHRDSAWHCTACEFSQVKMPPRRYHLRTIPQAAVREYLANPMAASMKTIATKYGINASSLQERIAAEPLPRRPWGGRPGGAIQTAVRAGGFMELARQANELRQKKKLRWSAIAEQLGYVDGHAALIAAKKYREGGYSAQRRKP